MTRLSEWVKGWRLAAYTRFAPLFKASSTSARPMPRFAPVIKIVLFSMFITFSFRIIVSSIGYYASARQGGYVPGERFWFYPASASRSRTSVPPRRAQLGACVCLRTNWSHSVCRNTVGDLVPFLWTLVKRNYRGAYIGRRGM